MEPSVSLFTLPAASETIVLEGFLVPERSFRIPGSGLTSGVQGFLSMQPSILTGCHALYLTESFVEVGLSTKADTQAHGKHRSTGFGAQHRLRSVHPLLPQIARKALT